MSLVEKALKKIQSSGVSPQGNSSRLREDREGPVPPPVGTVSASGPGSRAKDRSRSGTSGKVVTVSRAALRSAGLLPPEHQERQLADQYRQIKRPLIAAAMAQDAASNAHLIMVTSALPGDGKTFTSINLAISMSVEKDITVLLIDADVAKPHVTRIFGLENEQGFLDAIRDPGIDIESLILPTDVPGLSILPAGTRSEHATELLASQRMHLMVNDLISYDRSRVVVFDSPPMLITSESQALAEAMGQIVLVVRANSTSQQAVMEAVSHLGQDKMVGLVLNQSISAGTPGYHYGYGDEEPSASARQRTQ